MPRGLRAKKRKRLPRAWPLRPRPDRTTCGLPCPPLGRLRSGYGAASVVQYDVILLLALAFGLTGIYAAVGPFFSLPSSFLRGAAAAGGIGLFNAIGNFGAFFGPTLFGVLREGSGDYASGMA